MSGMNVDGLISGLGTSDLISSLMQVEALPQAKLIASVAKFGKVAAAYRELNTRFDAIGKAAEVLGKAETWNSTKATTSQTSFATATRSEEHTSELQSLMRISYAVFCLKKKNQ